MTAPVVERQPVAFWYWPKNCPADKSFTTNHKLPPDFYEVVDLYTAPPELAELQAQLASAERLLRSMRSWQSRAGREAIDAYFGED